MDKEEALGFLRQHQPMPDDNDLSQAEIDKYNEVRKYFMSFPDVACVPLFLNSFGKGDCFGVYQLVELVIEQFSRSEVKPHLLDALVSPFRSVRYWSAQIAAGFPDKDLIEPLSKLLQENDPDVPCAAATALSLIEDEKAKEILGQTIITTQDNYLREFIREELSYSNE
ncbi:MAG: HEAT repeat domain-containing protein [Abitibacteriaceae bacterium]|nr:HEAT repeat domain-containing protein [Abditibacteriaceae bacterium]MBV9867027.1 HEAT repeat domain-containing protein [Abditibacteriaceae bacterium]